MPGSDSPSSNSFATTELLRTIKFLSDVEERILRDLATSARQRAFKVNTTLFHEGDPGHVVYMVLSGWVRIERLTSSGKNIILAKRGPGTQLGELALIDGAPRMADAVTDTDCEVLTLERQDFLRCLEKSPAASLAVMASLAEMVRNSGASLENYVALDTMGRLTELLLWYCDRDGSIMPDGCTRIGTRITQQMLADEIGSARESVSRSLRILTDSGVIRKEGKFIIVVNKQNLQSMSLT
jgi:CRP/FNR family cyclic AMP-dependent transcriptional regulator